MNSNEILEEKREEILRIAAQHGAQNVRIFGSVARRQAGPESDVDLLVDLQPGRSLFDLGGLLMDLQHLLSCKVDVVTEKGLRPRIRVIVGGAPITKDWADKIKADGTSEDAVGAVKLAKQLLGKE